MDETFKLIVEIGVIVIALAFVIQMVMFIFIYSSMRKMRAIAEEVQGKVEPVIEKVVPVIEQVQSTIATVTSTVENINSQAKDTFDKVNTETRAVAAAISVSSQEITKLARHQAEQFSSTLDQTASTLQRQVADLDRLLTRTQDRIEYTTVEVQSTVLDPIREVSALLIGIKRAIETLMGRDRKQIDKVYQDEEMFI